MSAGYPKMMITLLSLLSVSCCFAQQVSVDSSYMNSQYSLRLEYFRKMPDRKNEIVFLGNSLTEGGKWQELIRRKNVINRGISGDVTFGILARLDEVLSSRPARIFLLCGINDMKRGTPNEVILANIKKIITRIKEESPATRLIIQSLLPVNEGMLPESYSQISNAKIDALNLALEALCKQRGVDYIDLHPALEDEKKQLRKDLTIDGLHLRQASYILWADYLKKSRFL